MSSLPKYYFRDIPAVVMNEIVAGMIDGQPEPTVEELEEWLTAQRECEAETLLVSAKSGLTAALFLLEIFRRQVALSSREVKF